VGQKSAVASTQLGLFSASTNLAIVYMTWADGQGYKHFGVHGLLMTDGLAGLISGIALLVLLGRQLKKMHLEKADVSSTPDALIIEA
jgi:predicted MFS family arabinose efflux permease